MTCERCSHPDHGDYACGYPITETINDTVGIFAKPTGTTREILVGTCSCITDEVVYAWIESHYSKHMSKHLLDEHKRLLLGEAERGPLRGDPSRGFLPADLDKILQTVRHARACIRAGHEPLGSEHDDGHGDPVPVR